MRKTKFTISQSLVKQMYRKGDEVEHCPAQINALYIEKSASIESLTFDRGNYFEYLAIGAGAIAGNVVDDLPRLKNGDKSVDQIRIEEQAMRFKSLMPMYGMKPLEVQKIVKTPWVYDDDVTLRIVIDFISPIKYRTGPIVHDYDLALIDLKLTQNINNTFGDFSWGFPANMDLIQAVFYYHVWEEHTGEKAPFYYWVFDHKKNPENKIIRKKDPEPIDLAELHESIRKTHANLIYYAANEWPTNPNINLCKRCPLKDLCKDSVVAVDNILEV